MRAGLSLLRKELASLWLSPLPYVVGGLLHLVAGVLFVEQLDVRGQALYQPYFPIAGFLLVALLPILTMRLLAEEARTGTLALLLSIPVPARRLVLGKWLAAWLSTAVLLAPAGAGFALVALWGDPDAGPAISGSLGLVLLSGALAAVGLAASAFTRSQSVAALVSFFVGLLLWFSHVGSDSWAGGRVLAHLSLSERLRSFAGGAVDGTDVALLAVLAGTGLALAGLRLYGDVAHRGQAPSTTRRRRFLLAAVAAGALLAGDRVAAAWDGRWDLTAESSLTLSEETREVVAAIDAPVVVTAFIPRTSPLRTQTATLLERYRDLNRRISFRLVDPGRSPGEAARLGIDPEVGGINFRMGDRSQTASLASEQDITAALARVQRTESPGVCFTVGHGEVDPSGGGGADMGAAAGSLVANGYRVRTVNLLSEPTIPEGCEGIVVANPVIPLGEGAVASLASYLAAGGRALVMADPLSTAPPDALLAPYGLGTLRGLVVEGDSDARLGPDPLTLVVREFRSPSPVVRSLPPVLFAAALGVTAESDPAAGLAADPLASSSAASFLETQPAQGRADSAEFSPAFDPASDRAGPVTLAAAADRSERAGEGVIRTRIVLVGDSDWATNAFLGEGGNSRLFIQAMDWLTLEEDLVSVTTNLASYRPLELSPRRLTMARGIMAGGVPMLIIGAGVITWLVRRRL